MSTALAHHKRDDRVVQEPVLTTYASDFETTIQQYVTSEVELRGILNFSAIWHEVVFVNDIALGDNPHLIKSFLDPAQAQLYLTVTEFIKAGILRCHFRDKVVIKGKLLVPSEPSLSQIYEGWVTDGPKERFTLQLFGENRSRYNCVMDDLLGRFPAAIERYDPDKVKPAFRDHIRKLVNTDSDLRRLLEKLPQDVQREYRTICDTNLFFTNADLWRLVRQVPESKELVVAHGHINQCCCADLAHAGMSGADYTSLQIRQFNWNVHVGSSFNLQVQPPKSLDEILERAEKVLDAPTLAVLALLTPDQVILLREHAKKTIFKIAHEGSEKLWIDSIQQEYLDLPTLMKYLPIDEFRTRYVEALHEYWQHICEFLEMNYPEHTRTKTKLGIIAYENLPTVPSWARAIALTIGMQLGMNFVVPHGDYMLKTAPAGALALFLNWALGKLGYHILLQQTPEMQMLTEKLRWNIKRAYATNRWT